MILLFVFSTMLYPCFFALFENTLHIRNESIEIKPPLCPTRVSFFFFFLFFFFSVSTYNCKRAFASSWLLECFAFFVSGYKQGYMSFSNKWKKDPHQEQLFSGTLLSLSNSS